MGISTQYLNEGGVPYLTQDGLQYLILEESDLNAEEHEYFIENAVADTYTENYYRRYLNDNTSVEVPGTASDLDSVVDPYMETDYYRRYLNDNKGNG